MADDGLFIGWGEVVRGRETKAVEVFNEAVEYWSGLQRDGRIESFEPWFLATHGGDLGGLVLVRGEREKLDAVVRSPEFERLQARVTMIVDGSGVIQAATGESLARQMGQFREATADLAS